MATTETALLANSSWNDSASQSSYCVADDDDSCYANFTHFVHMMDLIAVPVIIVVGVIGNVVSCLVFTCTYLRRVSSSVYLAALAVVDTVYLCVLFFSWLVNIGIQVLQSDQTIYLTVFNSVRVTAEDDEKRIYYHRQTQRSRIQTCNQTTSCHVA